MEVVRETLLHYPLGSTWISIAACHSSCIYFKNIFKNLLAQGTLTIGTSIPLTVQKTSPLKKTHPPKKENIIWLKVWIHLQYKQAELTYILQLLAISLTMKSSAGKISCFDLSFLG